MGGQWRSTDLLRIFFLLALFLRVLIVFLLAVAVVVGQRFDMVEGRHCGRHQPGAAHDGEENGADCECHAVQVIAVALLELVIRGVDEDDGEVLIKNHDDEAQEPANHR